MDVARHHNQTRYCIDPISRMFSSCRVLGRLDHATIVGVLVMLGALSWKLFFPNGPHYEDWASPTGATRWSLEHGFDFQGFEGVYMGKNDGLYELEHILMSLKLKEHTYPISPDVFISVVGSMSLLDILAGLSPKRLILFDINPQAIQYGKLMIELVKISATCKSFLSAVFCRDAERFELEHETISVATQEKFLRLPHNDTIYRRTMSLLSTEAQQTFAQSLALVTKPNSFWVKTEGQNPITQRLVPCDPVTGHEAQFSRDGYGCSHSGLGMHLAQIGKSSPRTASMRYGQGFLRDQETYSRVRRSLEVPTEWISLHIDTELANITQVCAEHGSQSAAFFSSDIFVRKDYGNKLTKEKRQQLRKACGSKSLVWLQTMAHSRKDLASDVDSIGGVRSFSNWDSRGLHSRILERQREAFCQMSVVEWD